MNTKRMSLIAVTLAVLAGGVFVFLKGDQPVEETQKTQIAEPVRTIIGTSVQGRAIEEYTFNQKGTTHLIFIGAIHGGYEWNTVVLARRFIEYLIHNPDAIPAGVKVSVVPVANPDGVARVFGESEVSAENAPPQEDTTSGRFNENDVDLNRNFDCNWQPESMWRGEVVDAGSGAFSEPEAAALRDFIVPADPDLVIFWHSAANGVYGASCNDGLLSDAEIIMNLYAEASGYPAISSFDHYEITGDAEGWLAKLGIPSLSVELKSHETIEWEENLAGIEALFTYYDK